MHFFFCQRVCKPLSWFSGNILELNECREYTFLHPKECWQYPTCVPWTYCKAPDPDNLSVWSNFLWDAHYLQFDAKSCMSYKIWAHTRIRICWIKEKFIMKDEQFVSSLYKKMNCFNPRLDKIWTNPNNGFK